MRGKQKLPKSLHDRAWSWTPGSEPLLPYQRRRDYIIRFIGARQQFGLIRPIHDTYWGGTMQMRVSDIDRMIEEGDLVVSRISCGGKAKRTVLHVASHLLPSPEVFRVPDPYAKRKAALKEFNQLNNKAI